jgi:hypothetical protein
MKGIIFAGCSFTWGEALELYSDYPTIRYDYYKQEHKGYYFPEAVMYQKPGHVKFIESNRFARKVAQHFNTFDLVYPKNGGSLTTMRKFISSSLLEYEGDIEYIVLQFTEILRDVYIHDKCTNDCCSISVREILNDRISYECNELSLDEYKKYKSYELYNRYFNGKTPIDIDNEYSITELIKTLKFLLDIQKTGIKIKLLGTWTNDIQKYENLKNIDLELYNFYKENLVSIESDGKEYETIFSVYNSKSEYRIATDLPWSNNDHPSLKFHNLISDSIIKNIENDIYIK